MRKWRVGILGAGRSGLAAAKLAHRLGAKVLLSEREVKVGAPPPGVEVERGKHSARLLGCDLLIRSPGVSRDLPILQKARRRGIPVWSELELASRRVQPSNIIAITGTNGKTTTTTLAGEFYKASGRPTVVAGNIGTPLSEIAMRSPHPAPSPQGEGTAKKSPLPGERPPGGRVRGYRAVVLEVSSYQLENIHTFHPTISAILNLTPDHLEHHGSMRAYAAAKARIFENQSGQDVCVLNADDAWCRRLAKRCPARVFFFSRKRKLPQGIYWECGNVVLRWKRLRARWRLETRLPGPHNIENILAAAAIAAAGRIPLRTIRRVLAAFRGVEHRLEWIRTLAGVRYVNDSKATNVDSARVALASFEDPLIVIMGGRGKGAPYAPLKGLIRSKAKRLLLIGEDAPRLERELGDVVPCERLGGLTRAVARARQLATRGDVVLLSPACASFDQYKNYEERGRHFKALVRKLR